MEQPRTTVDVASVLANRRGSHYLGDRVAKLSGRIEMLDHLYCSTAGAMLLQERALDGDVRFADGTMLRQPRTDSATPERRDERALLDSVRRLAEEVESAIVKPVEPVLVITDGSPFHPRQVRGVHVVHAGGLGSFIDGLPDAVDRPEMVLLNARLAKLTRPSRRSRRIPEWEVSGVIHAYTDVPGPGRPKRGPRDYAVDRDYAADSAMPSRSRHLTSPSRRRAPRGWKRYLAIGVVAALLVLVALGLR